MKTRLALALLFVIALLIIVPAVARSPQQILETPQPSSATPVPTAVLTPTPDSLESYSRPPDPAPTRDLYAITPRLKPNVALPIPRVVNKDTPQYVAGQKQTFWISDMERYAHFSVSATLRYVSPHAYFYVEDGSDIGDDEVRDGANDFENIVFPRDRKYFGTEQIPGIDNDSHLTILMARIPGVAGYFSIADEYPKLINPFSNEREMIYISLPGTRPGSRGFAGFLAHEYAHAIHWNEQPNQETWISEGVAELASSLAGFSPVGMSAFLNAPDTGLTAWSDDQRTVHRYYGAAYLFMKYLFQEYGGYESIKDFFAEKQPGVRGINSYLKEKGFTADFNAVFKDWVVANYLDEPGSGRFSYSDDTVKVAVEAAVKSSTELSSSVSQYGTDYYEIEIPSGDATVRFQGDSTVRLIANDPHSGRLQWYGNRGDAIDSTLTREFDLSGRHTATLRFWAWYDIEEPWDYAYVEASEDQGTTWHTLSGPHTTRENPVGNNFGDGYTGESGSGGGPEWIEETVDLSPYAGKRILLRFEYITDEGLNKPGFAIDDITIPELGFRDDAESDAGWIAEGFSRTSNVLQQRFLVQVIRTGAGGTTVETMRLAGDQVGELAIRGFGSDLRKATIAISGLTPTTTEMAGYRLSVVTSQ